MKKNFSKLKNCVMAILGVLTLGTTALGISSLPVKAETTKNYTPSELTYFTAEGATVKSYKDRGTETSYAGMPANYYGVLTEVTLNEGSNDFEITLNAKVDVTKDFMTMQYWGGSTNPAKAVIFSYRSIADPTKVINVISRYSSDHGGYASVLTLTDDYTFDANYHYVYLKGTKQWAVGEQWGDYIPGGYGRGGSLASNLETNMRIFTSGDNAGLVRYNRDPSTWAPKSYGDINSEEFLTASTSSLPADSEYRNLYTADYVNALLADFETNGVIFSIKAIDVADDAKFSISIMSINGSAWNVTGDIPATNLSSYLLQTTKTLYVGESYTISSLIDHRIIPTGFLYGFYGVPEGKGWDEGGTFFENKPNLALKMTTAGEYKILAVGRYGTDGNTKTYTFIYNVIEKPSISFGESKYSGMPGATVTVPNGENTVDKAFVAWESATGELVFPGTTLTFGEDAVYTAKYIEFGVIEGASVRLLQPYGIRFSTEIAKSDVAYLTAAGLEIKEMVTTITSIGSTKSVEITLDQEKKYDSQDGAYDMYNAALTNIKAENLTRIYYAKTTMILVDAEGTEYVVEGTVASEEGRSYAQVIAAAKADVDDGDYDYTSAAVTEINKVYAEVINENLSATVTFEFVTVTNGVAEDITVENAEWIKNFYAENSYKNGDTIVLTADDLPTVNGYVVDTENSVLEVTCDLRGAHVKVVYKVQD